MQQQATTPQTKAQTTVVPAPSATTASGAAATPYATVQGTSLHTPPSATVARAVSAATASQESGAARIAWRVTRNDCYAMAFTAAIMTGALVFTTGHSMIVFSEVLFVSIATTSHDWRRRAMQSRRAAGLSEPTPSQEKVIVGMLNVAALALSTSCVACLTAAGEHLQQYSWAIPLRTDPLKAFVLAANVGACAYILCEQVRLWNDRRTPLPDAPTRKRTAIISRPPAPGGRP